MQKAAIRYTTITILTILCMLGLARVCEISGELNALTNSFAGLIPVIVTPLLLSFYFKNYNRRLCIFSSVGGIMLSAAYVCGMFLFYQNYMFENIGQFFLLILWVLCVSILTTPLMAFLLKMVDHIAERYASEKKETYRPERKMPTIAFFFLMWLAFFISFLPIFLCQWPGNFVFDAPYQMSEVVLNAYKVHHPLLHTLLMGKMYLLGQKLGSASLGFSFYTLIQMLILSASFAGAMVYIRAHIRTTSAKRYKLILILAFVFYAIVPIHAVFSISATKDVLFAAFYLIFSLVLFRLVCEREKLSVAQWILLFVSGCLVILFRKNALLALLPSAIFMCITVGKSYAAQKGGSKKTSYLYAGGFLLLIAVMILTSNLVNRAVISAVNAYDGGSRREALSVPLQQMARVACYEKDNLDPALFSEITLYIPEGNIPGYNPFCSDPIKNEANEALLRSNFGNFLKLWFKIGLRYPDEYIESFLSNTMGYWYTQATGYELGGDIASYHMLIGVGEELTKANYFPIATKYYDYLFFYQNYKKVPVLAMLFRPAVYFWALGFYLLAALYRKKYASLNAMSLPIFYYATLFFGPMIAIRYAYNLVIFFPILILCFVKFVIKSESTSS